MLNKRVLLVIFFNKLILFLLNFYYIYSFGIENFKVKFNEFKENTKKSFKKSRLFSSSSFNKP
jgi:hypothetical protein